MENKSMLQVMKDRIAEIARKSAEIKPFPFMVQGESETDESEEN